MCRERKNSSTRERGRKLLVEKKRKFSFTFQRWRVTRRLCCIISFLVHKHIASVKSCSIVSAVAFKGYAKELSVALHVEFLLLTAMPRILPVPRHVIRKFDEVARRHRFAAVTLTSFILEIKKIAVLFLDSCDNLILSLLSASIWP